MSSRIERIIVALMIALLFAGVTLVVAQAQDGTPPVESTQQADAPCAVCHDDFQKAWEDGLHGHAGNDPIFLQAWEAQGKPGACLVCHVTGYDPAAATWKQDGVTCEACHGVVSIDHPNEPAAVDRSPDLCGRCHSDTRFGWQDWQGSTHYQRGMDCNVCHDSHTAGMKSVPGSVNVQDASNLCENCHKEAMDNFPSSKHAEAGVTCVNCHLGFRADNESDPLDLTEAHKAPDHSFIPTLDTCNKCHSTQMHAPGESVAAAAIRAEEAGGTPTPQPSPVTVDTPDVSTEPSPVSPIGYAGLAGLVGLAAGMVMAPWLERFYHRVTKHNHNEE